jgi:SAM-dependent methyltransferase
MPKGWEWDETLYLGSAPYYVPGRLPYAAGLAARLANVLALDGGGRLLDVGCGPGVLALLLAHLFEEVIGVDPDPGMLAEAARRAEIDGVDNARWIRARAEELSPDIGTFRVATFGQSFHWMDRPRVAAIVRELLEPGGAFVQVADVKEPPAIPDGGLPHPSPPFDAIAELVRRFLGPVRRAGQGMFPLATQGDIELALHRAGLRGPEHLRVSAGQILARSVDDIVAWVYSLSSSTPHLFGSRRDEFETELRSLLTAASPSGLFAEVQPDTEAFIWRRP